MERFIHVKEFFSGMGLLIKILSAILFVALIGAAIIFGPFLTIWALNTLFGTGIAYTFKTWLAIIVIHTIFAQRAADYKGKK